MKRVPRLGDLVIDRDSSRPSRVCLGGKVFLVTGPGGELSVEEPYYGYYGPVRVYLGDCDE